MDATQAQEADSPNTAEQDYTPAYKRVSPEQAGEIIRLRQINPNITYREIAAAIGVKSVSTVSHWINALGSNTVPEARKLARSQAFRATLKLADQVDHTDPRVSQGAAKAVVALAGVAETGPAVQVGVQVIVGSPGQPAGPDPFEAQAKVTTERSNRQVTD